jgi:guanidinoacetate N-methyltransferase
MIRKLKRSSSFDLTLEVKDDAFVRPPEEPQRHWLLNRFMREATDDLRALHGLAERFVPGAERSLAQDMRTAYLSDAEIMEDWQLPLMRAMADVAGRSGANVLEVGFGLGVSAEMLQEKQLGSHTVIECNQSVVGRFHDWRAAHAGRDIRLVEGLWQDVIDDLGTFDSIFFHTYALDEDEAAERLSSVTFADNFLQVAAEHLVDGGTLTYLTGEIDSLSRSHQRLLFEHFTSIRIEVVPLELPRDVRDAWWADSMIVVEATK